MNKRNIKNIGNQLKKKRAQPPPPPQPATQQPAATPQPPQPPSQPPQSVTPPVVQTPMHNTNIIKRGESRKRKVLIQEVGACHFELVPSWVYYFDKCGFDVYVNCVQMGHRDIYPVLINQKLRYKQIKRVVNDDYKNYDIVINNTFYPTNKIGYIPDENDASSTKLKGSVVHVINPFSDVRINNEHHVLITLANHMNQSAMNHVRRTMYMYPIFFRAIPVVPKRVLQSTRRIFMVQGTFDNGRRNYNTLINTIKSLKHRKDFLVVIMGSGGDLSKIRTQLNDCAQNVQILTNLKYESFFEKIYNSHFVLPLVDRNTSVKKHYFRDKITSSVMMSVGHVVPMLCDVKIQELYGLKDDESCLSYTNAEQFTQQFIRAIEMPQLEYDAMVAKIYDIRTRWMDTSMNNIKKWFGTGTVE